MQQDSLRMDDFNTSIASSRKQVSETKSDSKSITEEVEGNKKSSIRMNPRIDDKPVTPKISNERITNITLPNSVFEKNKDETIEELQSKVSQLEKQNVELKENIKRIKLDNSRVNLSHNDGDEDGKDKAINDLRTENEYYIEEIDQLKTIIADLKFEKAKVYEEKVKSIKTLNEEISQLKENNLKLDRLNGKLSKDLKELEEKNESLNLRINDLNTKIVQNE
jgi:chromosome segregation ATPase